jgi:hypothetical protein
MRLVREFGDGRWEFSISYSETRFKTPISIHICCVKHTPNQSVSQEGVCLNEVNIFFCASIFNLFIL